MVQLELQKLYKILLFLLVDMDNNNLAECNLKEVTQDLMAIQCLQLIIPMKKEKVEMIIMIPMEVEILMQVDLCMMISNINIIIIMMKRLKSKI